MLLDSIIVIDLCYIMTVSSRDKRMGAGLLVLGKTTFLSKSPLKFLTRKFVDCWK